MKWAIYLLALTLGLTASARMPHAETEANESLSSARTGGPDLRGSPRQSPGFDMWLDRLRREDSEEFERLQTLRRDSPEEFFREAKKALREEFVERLKRERPAVFTALKNLSPEDRDWVLSRMSQRFAGGMDRRDMERPDHGHPPDEPGEDTIRKLAQAYREAPNDAAKGEIKTQLRAALGEAFDRRAERRRGELAQFEKRIGEMRSTLESRQARRDEIIDRRLGEILEGSGWSW